MTVTCQHLNKLRSSPTASDILAPVVLFLKLHLSHRVDYALSCVSWFLINRQPSDILCALQFYIIEETQRPVTSITINTIASLVPMIIDAINQQTSRRDVLFDQ